MSNACFPLYPSNCSCRVIIAASVVGVGSSNRRGSNVGNTNEIVLKEKLNLTIKETVNKDAQSVYATSIRSGFLMKRNEQGMYAAPLYEYIFSKTIQYVYI